MIDLCRRFRAFENGTRGLVECGSFVLDIDSSAGTLRGRFLNIEGIVRDDFTIIKAQQQQQQQQQPTASSPPAHHHLRGEVATVTAAPHTPTKPMDSTIVTTRR